MKRKGMSLRERREYEQLQARKKRQMQRRTTRKYEEPKEEFYVSDELDGIDIYDYDDSDERDFYRYDEDDLEDDDFYEYEEEETGLERWINRGERQNTTQSKNKKNRNSKKNKNNRNNKKRPFRNFLPGIHGLAAAAFLGSMLLLNILPAEYFVVLAAVLFLLWVIGYFSNKKGKKAYNIFMILVLGVGAFYIGKISGALGDITGGGSQVNMNINSKPFSVYVSGIDVYGDIDKKSRSDVNIIATVNPKTKQILLVTTPRDYYVEIPGVSGGKKDKLTHAGLYGVEASMKTLEALYDVKIPFYARVNFTSMIDIVDKLGGIDVNSEYEFTTGKASGEIVNVSKGINHFNGKQALAFSRERHNLADGDNQRGKNQQAVITGMIKKAASPAILIKANGIIDSVSGNVETNMSQRQLQSLIKMQLVKGSSWKISSVAAEGTGARNYCYSSGSSLLYVTKPDYNSVEKIKSMIDRVENGEILENSETTK